MFSNTIKDDCKMQHQHHVTSPVNGRCRANAQKQGHATNKKPYLPRTQPILYLLGNSTMVQLREQFSYVSVNTRLATRNTLGT